MARARGFLMVALWLGWVVLGYRAIDRIDHAYQLACGDGPCASIDGALAWLSLVLLVSALALPFALEALRARMKR